MTKATDIEIYIRGVTAADLELWLSDYLDDLTPAPRRKGMPKSAIPFQGQWQGQRFAIIVMEKAMDGFTSLWLNYPDLPWRDDADCGEAAARHFDREVRIAAGGWREGADPDAWLSIDPDGQHTEIQWKTE